MTEDAGRKSAGRRAMESGGSSGDKRREKSRATDDSFGEADQQQQIHLPEPDDT